MYNKRVILLTELYNNYSYDDDNDNNNELELHYMLIGIYEPYTYYLSHLNYNNDICKIIQNDHNKIHRNINKEIISTRMFYKKASLYPNLNTSISNYYNIVQCERYIKPEIGQNIQLESGHCVSIIKTIWIKLIQRTWKKIYKMKKDVIQKRQTIASINHRKIK
jgi:hypothetical protein